MSLFLIVIAYVYLASVSIVLTLIDVRSHRLPNAIVLPSYAVLAMLFTGACLFGAPWQNLLRAAIGAATLFGFYWLLRAIRPGGDLAAVVRIDADEIRDSVHRVPFLRRNFA